MKDSPAEVRGLFGRVESSVDEETVSTCLLALDSRHEK